MACLVAASAFSTDAFAHRMWLSFVYGVLVGLACVMFLLRRLVPGWREAPATAVEPSDEGVTLAAYVDQAPVPLLSFNEGQGWLAVNRAARGLFETDDLIKDPPPSLVNAIDPPGPNPSGTLMLFGKAYAIGVSEVVTAKAAIKLISLVDIQSEIRMAEATALRDLLRVLSHEIMNSLTPVSNLAGIARDYLADETSQAAKAAGEALDLLSQRAGGLANFVEAYRALARLPDPVLRTVELGTLLRDITRVFAQSLTTTAISLEIDVPATGLSVDLDETLFTQALLNVLTNAAEAVANGPQPGRIRVSAIDDGKDLRILVVDNGCGVPDALSPQIFHAFVTSKPSGTGTGLNLARQIALAHGGDLLFLGRDEMWSAIFAFVLPGRSTS